MADHAFWTHFHEKIWEKTPAHLGRAITPLLDRREIFSLAVALGASLADGDERLRISWCDDGKRTRTLPATAASAAFLPQRSDKDLAGYQARMASYETFFFQLPRLQLFDAALWPRLVAFARSFYPRTGVPSLMAWTDAYFGRYRATPFGVHVDGASNFTFGVDGEKTLYLWEPDFYESHMKSQPPGDYAPFISNATKLTVGPGEVIYWPSRYFHIAVPDGRFSVTMNFAFYPERSRGAWLARAFGDLLDEDGAAKAMEPPFVGSAPDDLLAAARSVAADVASGALERKLRRRVVEHTTRLGFEDPPPLRAPVRFEAGDHVVRMPFAEIACAGDVLAANGYSTTAPEGAGALVKLLATGRPVEVDASTRALFEELHRWGAVERHWMQGESR